MNAGHHFIEGECYTRRQIHEALGGSMQSYLPHRDGRVVCGCFTRDLNRDAPSEILVGDGPEIRRWAEALASQREAIPVFLKKGTDRWEFVGLWSYVDRSADPEAIRIKKERTGRTDISMILKLSKIHS
jgi:hypothetical protein